jgi:hypothetical protein
MKRIVVVWLVAACFMLGCGWQGRGQLKKDAPPASAEPQARQKAPEPVEVYKGLREQFLKFTLEELGPEKPPTDSKAYGVLMELGYDSGLASIISLSTGDASLYTGTGGGVIGGGGHETVKSAALAFVTAAGRHLPRMISTKEFPYAEIGRVRFYVLTSEGIFTVEAGSDEMKDRKHELYPLFRAGHEVITQLRLTTEKKE